MTSWRAKPTRFQDGVGTEITRVSLGGGPQLDAFGRLRVSNPALTLFDSQQHYDEQPLLWNTKLVGAGRIIHDQDESGTFLDVAAEGDQVIRQTKDYHRYQPGKSQVLKATGTMQGSGLMYVVQRSSVSGAVVENRVAQNDWNTDKFNGEGVSKITMDNTKSQIYFIDLEWLSVGQVRAGFVHRGIPNYAHVFSNENVNPGAYMKTANLPVRYEIKVESGILYQRVGYFDSLDGVFFEKQSVATSGRLLHICCAVESEGGFEESLGFPFSINTGTTSIAVTTRRPLLSIRAKQLFKGTINHGAILPLDFGVGVRTQPLLLELVYDGTLTGASFASVNDSSITEYDMSATTITGGLLIESLAIAASQSAPSSATASVISKLPLSLDLDNNPGAILTIVGSRIGTTTQSDVVAFLNWRELY